MIHGFVSEDYLSVDDLPRVFSVAGSSYKVSIKSSRTGYMNALSAVVDAITWQ